MKAIPFYVSIFIIMVGMLIVLVVSHFEITKEKIETIEDSYNTKLKKLNTDFEIMNIEHKDNLIITIMNTGSEKLLPNKIRVFMPLLRESTTVIDPDLNLINPLFFDPGERAYIYIEKERQNGINKSLSIVTENSVRKNINFKADTLKLKILSSKTSNNNEEQKYNLNESDNIETEITIQTDSEAFLWINYSLNKFISIQNSNIIIEHFFNNTNDIQAFLEFEEKNGWTTIGQLSNFETKNTDIFLFDKEATNFRIKYYSNNLNSVKSYIDKFEIISNVTKWWY